MPMRLAKDLEALPLGGPVMRVINLWSFSGPKAPRVCEDASYRAPIRPT